MARATLLRSLLPAAIVLSSVHAPGCVEEVREPEDETEEVGVATSAITVQEAVSASCSTMSVRGLSLQIIEMGNCIEPGAYVEVPDLGNISFSDSTFPFLEEPARDALVDALEENPGMTLGINSMLRTVAQQLLLYKWYQNGQCDIVLAATPGNSNHETGLAFDTSQYAAWRPALEAHGFDWYGTDDVYHFDYAGPGAVDYKGVDVLAFQRLWNDNNPGDPIDEDGVYGPQTEARLLASPAEGFANPVACGAPPGDRPDVAIAATFEDASDAFVDGPSAGLVDLFEEEPAAWSVLVTNTGAGAAEAVVVTVALDEVSFTIEDYVIEASATAEAPFEEDPATNDEKNPAHGAPLGPRADFHVGPLAAGQQKRVSLTIDPLLYSVDREAIPALSAWVGAVDDLYLQSEFGGEVTNVDGSQTFGGGRLELATQVDIYARTHWEWQSPRLEGVSGVGGITFSSSSTTLDVSGGQPGASISMPPSSLFATSGASATIRATRTGGTGPARLLLARASTDLDDAEAIELAIVDDGLPHEVTVSIAPGPIERIAVSPFATTAGQSSIDYLRLEGVAPIIDDEDDDDDDDGDDGEDDDGDGPDLSGTCTCRSAGSGPGGASGYVGLLVAASLIRRLRRRARRA